MNHAHISCNFECLLMPHKSGFGVAHLDECSESALLAVIRLLIQSRGAFLDRLLPFVLANLLALPFWRWPVSSLSSASVGAAGAAGAATATAGFRYDAVEQLAAKLSRALTELSVCVPVARRPVLRTLALLHRQCAFMTRQVRTLQPV
jgi:hypothetical protein